MWLPNLWDGPHLTGTGGAPTDHGAGVDGRLVLTPRGQRETHTHWGPSLCSGGFRTRVPGTGRGNCGTPGFKFPFNNNFKVVEKLVPSRVPQTL